MSTATTAANLMVENYFHYDIKIYSLLQGNWKKDYKFQLKWLIEHMTNVQNLFSEWSYHVVVSWFLTEITQNIYNDKQWKYNEGSNGSNNQSP
jgi:hypothetical protein